MAIYQCMVCFHYLDDNAEPPTGILGYDLVCPTCMEDHEEDKENNSEY